ncbi:MAG: PilZ domain-containing protein [Acidobacteriota bacterium]|nr:PilZ domain-containing protein [Acidobacteriota bacterium]
MGKERRSAHRYPVRLAFDFRAFGRDHSVAVGTGTTLNMSSHGLLIQTATPIVRSGMIELSVHLPESADAERAANLVILGQIVRADANGAAVRILRHGFFRVDVLETTHPAPVQEPGL